MSYRLFIQFEDDSVRVVRDIKEFAAEWGWDKAIYESRIIILRILSPSSATIYGEIAPGFLADMVDDFLAARVYFDKTSQWDGSDDFEKALEFIPYEEDVLRVEISLDQATRKRAGFRRWDGRRWDEFRSADWSKQRKVRK